jgi:hypothetical protein
MEAESALKLELAQKELERAAGKMASPSDQASESAAKAENQMKLAQQNLKDKPRAPPKAMQQAAGAAQAAAQQMGQQLGKEMARAPGKPSPAGGGMPVGGSNLPPALAKKLEPFLGRPWGELPGELKTQLFQDARASFGEDYAPIIQQYFEQVAGSSRSTAPPILKKQP